MVKTPALFFCLLLLIAACWSCVSSNYDDGSKYYRNHKSKLIVEKFPYNFQAHRSSLEKVEEEYSWTNFYDDYGLYYPDYNFLYRCRLMGMAQTSENEFFVKYYHGPEYYVTKDVKENSAELKVKWLDNDTSFVIRLFDTPADSFGVNAEVNTYVKGSLQSTFRQYRSRTITKEKSEPYGKIRKVIKYTHFEITNEPGSILLEPCFIMAVGYNLNDLSKPAEFYKYITLNGSAYLSQEASRQALRAYDAKPKLEKLSDSTYRLKFGNGEVFNMSCKVLKPVLQFKDLLQNPKEAGNNITKSTFVFKKSGSATEYQITLSLFNNRGLLCGKSYINKLEGGKVISTESSIEGWQSADKGQPKTFRVFDSAEPLVKTLQRVALGIVYGASQRINNP